MNEDIIGTKDKRYYLIGLLNRKPIIGWIHIVVNNKLYRHINLKDGEDETEKAKAEFTIKDLFEDYDKCISIQNKWKVIEISEIFAFELIL